MMTVSLTMISQSCMLYDTDGLCQNASSIYRMVYSLVVALAANLLNELLELFLQPFMFGFLL